MIPETHIDFRGVSFITFARNEADDLILTLECLRDLGNRLDYPIEVVAINDGSTDETQIRLGSYFNSGVNPYLIGVINQPPLGISFAISEGLKHVIHAKCIPIPGHYMFDYNGLQNLVQRAYSAEVVVGYRDNLRKERPIGKYLAAKVLRILFYFSISKKVVDPHGLIVYPTYLLREVINSNMEHENHIRALSFALARGLSIENIPIPIRSGHKLRSKEKGRPSAPRLVHLKTGLRELYIARKYFSLKSKD